MQEVVVSVKRVTGIIGEIALASQEQTEGIEQINQAVIRMDGTTQQNAALVEEAASAAESLQQQADKLLQSVGIFKLADSQYGDAVLSELPADDARPLLPHSALPSMRLVRT
jgi:methyl-accepting chemotaxis protein